VLFHHQEMLMNWKTGWMFLALLLIVDVFPLAAQEEEEEPLPPPRRQAAAKIGGAGGFTPLFLFWDVDAFNTFLPTSVQKFDKSPMFLTGGQGFAYIMLVENLRIGGMGVGGSSKTSAITGGFRRDVEVGINFGGVTIEYAIPIIERLDVVPGILFGGGSMRITMTRDDGSFKYWGSLWSDFDGSQATINYTRNLSGSFLVYQPSVQVEFAVLRWLAIRVGASYVGMGSPSWTLDEQFDVTNVPSKVNGQGWVIHTGIFAGTFLF